MFVEDSMDNDYVRYATFWYGEKLSPMAFFCAESFALNGARLRIYSYNSELKVPEGVELADAEAIVPKERIFFYRDSRAKNSVSAFSNYFRYKMIYDTGMCWTDTDVVAVQPKICASEEFLFANQDKHHINGALLRFPKGHRAMWEASEFCWEARMNAQWGDLGPRLVTQLVKEHGVAEFRRPRLAFYPIHWDEIETFFSTEGDEIFVRRAQSSNFVHLWNEVLHRKGIRLSYGFLRKHFRGILSDSTV